MKKTAIVLLHAGYWFLYLVLLFFLLICLQVGLTPSGKSLFSDTQFKVLFTTSTLCPAVLGFYSYYTLLFNYFLSRKKIVLLFVVGILVALLCGVAVAGLIELLTFIDIGSGIFMDGFNSAYGIVLFLSLIAVLNGGMGLLLKGFIAWFESQKTREALTQKNFEVEMALVKSQINPHFLFNTLNNIDVLIEKDAAKASLYLNQLSSILRYMLYETKSEQIPLAKEWTYLEQYIALQKIRNAAPDFVVHRLEGPVEEAQIAPMTLIPFVENAFKYAEGIKGGTAIDIYLRVHKKGIHFACQNKYLPQRQAHTADYGGLGNELIAKRLELLYPAAYTLETEDREHLYRVKLDLKNKL